VVNHDVGGALLVADRFLMLLNDNPAVCRPVLRQADLKVLWPWAVPDGWRESARVLAPGTPPTKTMASRRARRCRHWRRASPVAGSSPAPFRRTAAPGGGGAVDAQSLGRCAKPVPERLAKKF
jgi:hypothetical protein